jgi:C-terminal processing protease CtpA/Prc
MKEPTLGYIFIPTFDGSKSDFEAIGDAIDKLSDKKGLIIDVRSNGGGQTQNAELVASYFTDKSVVYGKTSAKIGPSKNDFSAWEETTVEPAEKNQYLKPVIILTNRKSFSSTEIFLMIMQNFPNVQIVGDRTGGGIGSPVGRELPNGWVYRLSTHRFVRPDGSTPEGKGIIPDFTVWNTANDVADGRDKMLEKAIDLLK